MKKKLFLLCFFLMSVILVKAQSITVNGTITDQNNNPLPGVNVLQKNTNKGVSTDFDGKYSITVLSDQAILQFSYLGFTTQEIEVGEKTTINITMIDDADTLDEVVVVGGE